MSFAVWNILGTPCELQASDNGKDWRKVAELPEPRQWNFPQTLPVPETKAVNGSACFIANGGSATDIKLSGDSLVFDYQPKASFHGRLDRRRKRAEDRIGSPTPEWAAATIKAKERFEFDQSTPAGRDVGLGRTRRGIG